jgi:peptide/nickel transport system permease protein
MIPTRTTRILSVRLPGRRQARAQPRRRLADLAPHHAAEVGLVGGAFPLLLFIIALASTVGDRLDNITLGFLGKGVVTIVLVLGCFGWFYPARIVRAQVLSLREKEFVEAARVVGASDLRIVRSHLLPHLVAPIVVLVPITVAQFVLLEAGLSFLGIGIKQPTASWGSLLATGPTYYLTQPWLMVWPGLAILLTRSPSIS